MRCAEHQASTAIHIYKGKDEKKTSSTANSCKDLNFDITRFIVRNKTFYNASVSKVALLYL